VEINNCIKKRQDMPWKLMIGSPSSSKSNALGTIGLSHPLSHWLHCFTGMEEKSIADIFATQRRQGQFDLGDPTDEAADQ
jgi:hypothetical protein